MLCWPESLENKQQQLHSVWAFLSHLLNNELGHLLVAWGTEIFLTFPCFSRPRSWFWVITSGADAGGRPRWLIVPRTPFLDFLPWKVDLEWLMVCLIYSYVWYIKKWIKVPVFCLLFNYSTDLPMIAKILRKFLNINSFFFQIHNCMLYLV